VHDTLGSDYLNNRYHDPALGAFISVDPLVAKTRMPYAYGANNPISFSDPSGLEPQSWLDRPAVYVVIPAPRYQTLRVAGAPKITFSVAAQRAGVDAPILTAMWERESAFNDRITVDIDVLKKVADNANGKVQKDSRRGELGMHRNEFNEAKLFAASRGTNLDYSWSDLSGNFEKSLESMAWRLAFMEQKLRDDAVLKGVTVVRSADQVPTGANALDGLALIAGSHYRGHYFAGVLDNVAYGIGLPTQDQPGISYGAGVVQRANEVAGRVRNTARGD
jgi:hypothetical protein